MPGFILVAHGFPSNPDPAEAALAALAARVGAALPEARVISATLAKPGSLAQALETLPRARIYPFFMAEGWFTSRQLPRRLADLGSRAEILSPFGADPGLPALVVKTVAEAGPGDLILCAHGSQVARSSRMAAMAMAERIGASLPGRRIVTAFLEEDPHLRDIAAQHPRAICLPFFALRAGHVAQDIPEALAQAGFHGRLLPAIGERPEAADLIAAALRRA